MNEPTKQAALDGYRQEFRVPLSVTDAEIQLFPDWPKWLRSWELATQAADAERKKNLTDILDIAVNPKPCGYVMSELARVAAIRMYAENALANESSGKGEKG